MAASIPAGGGNDLAADVGLIPTLAVTGVSHAEGNSGATAFVFTVSLAHPSPLTVTVGWATADGTAHTTDGDYAAGAGTLTFAPGVTSMTVTVAASGDASYETDETFSLTLAGPSNAAVAAGGGAATGTILNDDPAPTTTTLMSSPTPSVYGQLVTLTAAVAATPAGAGTPTGAITFYAGAGVLGTATLSGGVATLTAAALPVGSHTVTAAYAGTTAAPGTGAYAASSGTASHVVNKAATTTGLAADSTTDAITREVVRLVATVAPFAPGAGVPTGTVKFTVPGRGDQYAAVAYDPASTSYRATLLLTDTLPAGTYTLAAAYSGDGNFLASTGTRSFAVTPSPVYLTTPGGAACGVGGTSIQFGDPFSAANGGAGGQSAAGVGYAAGAVQVSRVDLAAGGPGGGWGQVWVWSSAAAGATGAAGNGSALAQVPRLAQSNALHALAVVSSGLSAHFFDRYDGTYHARPGDTATLVYHSATDTYTAADGTGKTFTFAGFATATPALKRGQFMKVVDAAGNTTEVASWDTAGRPLEVRQTTGTGGAAETLSYAYTYAAAGASAGKMASVTSRRQTGGGAWETVGSVDYTYHDGTGAGGTAGDLALAEVKDGAGAVVDTSYYRYYTAGGSGGGSGDAALLKYGFGAAAYARLTAALGPDVGALTDAQVAPYADKALAYDAQDRVATAVDAAAGCSVCAGGDGTFGYAYATNPAAGDGGRNTWVTKTVETLPDGNTNTVYANADGQVMLAVYTDAASARSWRSYTRYDAAGRVVLEAGPAAVSGYDEAYPDLVHYAGGNAEYLRDSDGRLTAYAYGAGTTATSASAGDVAGYLKGTDLLHGETGTPVPQQSQTYIASPAGTFVTAASTVYRNADGTGGQTTTYTYTWQGATAQPVSVTVTLPVVTTGQNGSGAATFSTTVYDARGRAEWSRDAGGFLTYTAYDPKTGAVVRTIADVDTAGHSDFAGLPTGWATPSGGGLHLVTTYEVDDQGRVTKATSPGGRVDYTVYDDAAHEVRSYAGWDAASGTPTGPTTVSREDRAGGYTETLTMSAAPHLTAGVPDGTEAIAAVQSLSRSYANSAGQTVYSDAYFDLTGLAYSTSTSLGASGVNFYRTSYSYDAGGRANKTTTPAGTISRTVYDGLARAVGEWVGTDDTPTTGFWSPTNLAGTDMVMVRSYEYDGGGVGDGNLTKVTAYPGGGAAPRVTETYYDWRDRAVATKSGVEATEATSLNRPITYVDYDNLGQVTKTRVYDGDGVAVTTTSGVPVAPSSGLLRAQSTTSYDELGRAYRTDAYGVDPLTGSVGSYTLHSDTWYDARGMVVKSVSPGGLVSKTGYDGAGRVTVSYVTDGGGDTGYADAAGVTGDVVLEQSEATYDADGNVLVSTSRQRFHDATGTGPLGTPTTGVHARVSYAGYYYAAGGRPTAVVDVGTNGGSAWTRPSTVPARSDTALVTSYEYAADAVQTVTLTGGPTGGTFTLAFGGQTTGGIAYTASAATVQAALVGLSSVGTGNAVVTPAAGGGWQVRFAGSLAGAYQQKLTAGGAGLTGGTSPGVAVATVSAGGDAGGAAAVTDPMGRVGRTYTDALGRTTQTVQNYTGAAASDGADKTTGYTYGPAGMTSLTAWLAGGGGQTTGWVYGVTGAVASNDVVGATQYPDATTGAASASEQETVTVNAVGQTVTSTDRNGTVHTLTYDVLGRVVSDAVTTLGTGVDGAVRRVETAYDGQGNAYLVTSYSAATGGSVVNQVQRAFNGLGQMVTEWQAVGGAVDTATSPKVGYAYSEMAGGANHSRLTSITYPSGYVLGYDYATGLDGSIGRLTSMSDAGGAVEEYEYLGLGTVVNRAHPQSTVHLTYYSATGPTGDAGDQYVGLDRFGRVVDQKWYSPGTGVSSGWIVSEVTYGYDRNGNRVWRDDLVDAAFGEVYTYDGLDQLASFARGTLNGTRTGVTGTAARTQAWDYDGAGNWDGVDVDGVTQARTANAQNEITGIGSATTPAYDANGNMTGDETGRTFVYDAWNRLVAVKSASSVTLETFSYDGLNRRVTNTVGSTTTALYYSAQWQVLEERQGGATTARYVWSPVYVDALILRDRATATPGTLDERLWAVQDANFNVVAVVDGAGTVVERYAYDPFGAVTVLTPTYGSRSTSSYAWTQGFQGMFFDSISGLNGSKGRHGYSPTLGVWVSIDPIRFAAGDVRLYGFVGNNPVNGLDPSGLAEPPRNVFWAGVGGFLDGIDDAGWDIIEGGGDFFIEGGQLVRDGFNARTSFNSLVANSVLGTPVYQFDLHSSTMQGYNAAVQNGNGGAHLRYAAFNGSLFGVPNLVESGYNASQTGDWSQFSRNAGSNAAGVGLLRIAGPRGFNDPFQLRRPPALPATAAAAEPAVLQGTNQRGQVTSRGSFRRGTVQDCWDDAAVGPQSGRLCPTCGTEVTVSPGSGPRTGPGGWDIDHTPAWTRRTFPPNVTRGQVLDNYQEGTRLECPSCNRSRGNR